MYSGLSGVTQACHKDRLSSQLFLNPFEKSFGYSKTLIEISVVVNWSATEVKEIKYFVCCVVFFKVLRTFDQTIRRSSSSLLSLISVTKFSMTFGSFDDLGFPYKYFSSTSDSVIRQRFFELMLQLFTCHRFFDYNFGNILINISQFCHLCGMNI